MALYLNAKELNAHLNENAVSILDKSTRSFQVKQLLDPLRQREEAFLKKFFGGISREALKKRLLLLREKVPMLERFNGAGMKRMINLFESQCGKKDAQEQESFTTALLDTWNSNSKNSTKSIEEFILSLVETTYKNNPTITIGEKSHGGRVYGLPSLREANLQLEDIFLTDLAPVTQARIRQWMKDNGYIITGNISQTMMQRSDNNLIVRKTFDWYSYSQGLKPSEVTISNKQLEQLNLDFKIDFIEVMDPLGQIPKLPLILDYMFQKNPRLLFIGKSSNQIIGLCGEIQALSYLSLLLGNAFNLNATSPSEITWAAQSLYNSKQAHEDIIMGRFGIQVKNSTKDIIDTLDFVDSTFETFLSNLVRQNLINESVRNDILTIYEAMQFNIPYKATYFNNKTITALAQDNDKFMPIRSKIIGLYASVEAILNRMVGQLMYIGTGNAFKNNPSNIMFFLSGQIIFASEVVEEIWNKLDSLEKSFSVNTTFNSSMTIVDAINENGKRIFNYPNITSSYERDILNNIRITSSYDFSSLLLKN